MVRGLVTTSAPRFSVHCRNVSGPLPADDPVVAPAAVPAAPPPVPDELLRRPAAPPPPLLLLPDPVPAWSAPPVAVPVAFESRPASAPLPERAAATWPWLATVLP